MDCAKEPSELQSWLKKHLGLRKDYKEAEKYFKASFVTSLLHLLQLVKEGEVEH